MTTFDITDAFLERLVQRGIVCMAWTQVYDPAGSVVLSALSAAIPLMVLFYMLAIRRAKGHVAAIVGLAVAFVLAVAVGDAFRHRGEFRRLRYGERLVPHRLDRHYGGVGVQHDRGIGRIRDHQRLAGPAHR